MFSETRTRFSYIAKISPWRASEPTQGARSAVAALEHSLPAKGDPYPSPGPGKGESGEKPGVLARLPGCPLFNCVYSLVVVRIRGPPLRAIPFLLGSAGRGLRSWF